MNTLLFAVCLEGSFRRAIFEKIVIALRRLASILVLVTSYIVLLMDDNLVLSLYLKTFQFSGQAFKNVVRS
jgi:hypothetical protein